MRILFLALVALLFSQPDAALQTRVMTAVRSAMAPALPFPASDEDGSLPAGNNTEALWMVRPSPAGDSVIEVLVNPLNEANQRRANAAMAQIDKNIATAQRRAEEQYDRAVAEAKRTGKSQNVDGVTLADEGAAGEKIDADSHVTIEVLFNEREYRFVVPGQVAPARVASFPHPNVMVAANEYDDAASGGRHYKETERIVFLGPLAPAQVTKRAGNGFDVVTSESAPGSGAISSLVIRMRGNTELLNDIQAKTNWAQLLELLK